MLEHQNRRSKAKRLKQWVIYNKTLIIRSGLVALGVLLLIQILYPSSRLLPFASVDSLSLGAWQKKDAANELDSRMSKQDIAIKLGSSNQTYEYVRPEEIGLKISNEQRVQQANYPWYMRVIPTSLFWYGLVRSEPPASVTLNDSKLKKYISKSLGKSCKIPAKNASLKYQNGSLEIVNSKAGGKCETEKVVSTFKNLQPRYSEQVTAKLPVTPIEPSIKDNVAKDLKSKLDNATKNGIRFKVGSSAQTISQAKVLSWLAFSAKNNSLNYSIDKQKTAEFTSSINKQVSKPAGTSYISTRDFTVVSKKTGATGRTLAVDSTLADIKRVIEGAQGSAKAFTATVKPTVKYTRTYTKTSTGIAALSQHYAEDNPGTYGVSFSELGGRGLNAQYNSTKRFTTASTYKLFVAYGVLRKVDSGKWKWSDKNIAGGRDLATCFDDMIVKSDNACAEALLEKLGLTELTKDIAKLGLYNSGFTLGDTPLTTAADLSLLFN